MQFSLWSALDQPQSSPSHPSKSLSSLFFFHRWTAYPETKSIRCSSRYADYSRGGWKKKKKENSPGMKIEISFPRLVFLSSSITPSLFVRPSLITPLSIIFPLLTLPLTILLSFRDIASFIPSFLSRTSRSLGLIHFDFGCLQTFLCFLIFGGIISVV